MYIQQSTSNAGLWALTQAPKETLQSYIDRFKVIVSRAIVTDDAALPTLRNDPWFESAFKEDMKLNKPHNLEDALHRATLFIKIKEENATLIMKHTPIKTLIPKDKARKEYYEP